jgi:hypothetical protein
MEVESEKKTEPEFHGKCKGCVGVKPHGCPYAQEIHGDYETLCNCCDECAQQCLDDT